MTTREKITDQLNLLIYSMAEEDVEYINSETGEYDPEELASYVDKILTLPDLHTTEDIDKVLDDKEWFTKTKKRCPKCENGVRSFHGKIAYIHEKCPTCMGTTKVVRSATWQDVIDGKEIERRWE